MAPLDGKQNVSRGTDLYNHQKGYTDEQLLKVQFSEGEVLSQNKGTDVPLSTLASDETPFTGRERGFYVQNKAMRNRLVK